ncbi:hypothetical protein HOC00_05575 [Candidatus Peregrinibacteria bacterium]|jgi:hypothetical protein|nr:hypothetical protein [Candidatus Peregrinibacteria bacterium]
MNMRKPAKRKLNFTVVFCEDEEENQIAFENAVRILLSDGDQKGPFK